MSGAVPIARCCATRAPDPGLHRMPNPLLRRLLQTVTLLCLSLLAPLVAQADSLTTVEGADLPALPAVANVQSMFVLDDRPVVFGSDRAWALASDGKVWREIAWARVPSSCPASGGK